jgi:hypothetical protein
VWLGSISIPDTAARCKRPIERWAAAEPWRPIGWRRSGAAADDAAAGGAVAGGAAADGVAALASRPSDYGSKRRHQRKKWGSVSCASVAATLRTALGVLLVLNVIPLGLLIASLRSELARTWRVWMLALGGGTLIPLGLVLVGSGAPLMLGAVLLLLLGSLVIRFLIIRIPHVRSTT